MGLLHESAYDFQMPKMYKVVQSFDDTHISDVTKAVKSEFAKPNISSRIKPGMKVAAAVGSRGINNLKEIVTAVVEEIKALNAEPVIVPSMGSHGTATAEGQLKVLEGYGITEDMVGAPIISSMEVVNIGKTSGGVPVLTDKFAHSCDLIVPIVRIKPHTDYKAEIESGICKMITIGLGNHEGCSTYHQQGFSRFGKLLPEAAKIVIDNTKIGFSVSIVENAYDKTYILEAVPAEDTLLREPQLLKVAKERMPSIMVPNIDVLIIDKIGKDISGAGMDPNIIGRTARGPIEGFAGPTIQRIVVKSISPASHGNACGIGEADFILESCLKEIDISATAVNSIASGSPEGGRIPICVSDIKEGVIASLKTCIDIDYQKPKIVRIESTLSLGEIYISEGLLQEVNNNPLLSVLEGEKV